MSDELKISHRVRQVLDGGTSDLDQRISKRLIDIREQALNHQRVAVSGLSIVGLSRFATESFSHHGRGFVAFFALAVGAVGAYYWNDQLGDVEQASAIADIDSALLADEVPFSAYLDQGFVEWLYHVSQQRDSEGPSPQ